jgi:hypothetical protein
VRRSIEALQTLPLSLPNKPIIQRFLQTAAVLGNV